MKTTHLAFAISTLMASAAARADGPVRFINNAGPNADISVVAYTGSANNCTDKAIHKFKHLRFRQPATVDSDYYSVCWCWGYSSQFNGENCGAVFNMAYGGQTIEIPRPTSKTEEFDNPQTSNTN